jgi:cell division protein FtsA
VERTIASIDVGTTKICTLIARTEDTHQVEPGEPEKLRVIGVGIEPARGLRRGVVTDVHEAAQAIGASIAKAERVAGVTLSDAYVSVGGAHIASQNNRGVAAIGKGDRPVDRDDIDRALESAQTLVVPHNRRIIHSLPRDFIIDGQPGVRNPVGLLGFRLEVEAHIVTGAAASIQNLLQCVNSNRVQVRDLVLQAIASAEAVLRPEEKELGVAVVDIGGGTVDLAVYVDGAVWDTQVLAVGGYHISNDIAFGLKAPLAVAEECKVRYAHANPAAIAEGEVIEVATFGGDHLTTIPRRELCDITNARVEEMFEMIKQALVRSGYDSLLPAGVVLTGGSANLRGIQPVAARVLGMPVRIGQPLDRVTSDVESVARVHGLVEAIGGPAYSTAIGLLLWGLEQERTNQGLALEPRGGSLFQRLRRWLRIFLP